MRAGDDRFERARYNGVMAKNKVRKAPKPARRKKKQGYTAGEWFMVILGLSLVVLVLGIIVTSVLGK